MLSKRIYFLHFLFWGFAIPEDGTRTTSNAYQGGMFGLPAESRSWTEDIPICKNSGIGLSTNLVYREDGNRIEAHAFEDRSFHFKYDDSTRMYGVFDGHDGAIVAKFALDNIVAEVLLGQLNGKNTDEEIKQVLRQAFFAVESSYLASIGDKLAEKAILQMELPDNINSYEIFKNYPRIINRLNALNTELSCGTTAVIALIRGNRLYVANVGDSRALLCRTDENGVLRVIQLSADHNLTNSDEILRLTLLGMPKENLKQGLRFGNQENTRCLGNYLVKGCYKEFEHMAEASHEPVIAEPELTGVLVLDDTCRFLMLMSSGLYLSVEEATGTENVNKEIAQMVVEQFRTQSTITGVAQAVVDKVSRIHHDLYSSRSCSDRSSISKREDITLLVRNFNFPMPNAIMGGGDASNAATSSSFGSDSTDYSIAGRGDTSEESSFRLGAGFPKNNRVSPYVDFSEYYTNVEKARTEGKLPRGVDFY